MKADILLPRQPSRGLGTVLASYGVLALALAAPAQAPSHVFHAQVREVMVDMVVTNQHGKTVHNLQPSQVEVFDNGVRQKLVSFQLVSRSVSLNYPSGGVGNWNGSSLSPLKLPKINLIALVFEPLSQYQELLAERGALHFIKHDLQPGDYVAVFDLYHRMIPLQPFTQNRRRLEEAVELATVAKNRSFKDFENFAEQSAQQSQIASNLAIPTGAQGQPSGGAQADALMAAAVSHLDHDDAVMLREQRTWATLPALLQLVRALGLAHGRKEMVYFTQDLVVDSNSSFVYHHVMRSANRHHVTIYIADPNGPGGDPDNTYQQLQMAASLSLVHSGAVSQREAHSFDTIQNARYSNPLAIMRGLADNTGGSVISDTNNLAPGLDRVAQDMEYHYEMTFVPSNPNPGNHSITIQIPGHPNWHIYSRKNYTAHAPGFVRLHVEPQTLEFPENPVAPEVELLERITSPGAQPLPPALAATALVKDGSGAVVETVKQHWPTPGTSVRWLTPLQLSPGVYTVETHLQIGKRTSTVVRQPLVLPALPPEAPRLSSVVLVRRMQRDTPQRPATGPLQFRGFTVIPHAGVPSFAHTGKAIGFYLVAYVPTFLNYKDPTFTPHLILHLSRDGRPYKTSAVPIEPPDAHGRIPVLLTLPESTFQPGRYRARFEIWLDGHIAQSRTQFVMQ